MPPPNIVVPPPDLDVDNFAKDDQFSGSVGRAFLRVNHRGSSYLGPIPRSPQDKTHFNVPDRFESYWREPGERCVDSKVDTRVPNCTIFHFHKEDHTVGNLLKYQLYKNKAVIFSGYKVPHPLWAEFELRVQTDGSMTPKAAVEQACREIIKDLAILSREFTKEFELFKVRNMGAENTTA